VFSGFAGVADPRLEILGDGEYRIYSTEWVENDLITNTTNLGFSYIYHLKSHNAAEVRKLFTKIDGESITLNNISKTTVLKKLGYKIVANSNIDNIKITYAYSPRGKTFIKDGAQKINLQIAKNKDTLIVGWPVILGSY